MHLQSTLRGILLALAISVGLPASADTVGPFTQNFNNLVTGTDDLQAVYSTFSFPKFDSSLGTLEQVHLAFDFSGTVVGSATGAGQASSFNGSINHWVFFDFVDISHNVLIAEPTLRLTAAISAGGQNGTILFGPEFQSTSLAFSVGSGDSRFEEWQDGPGNISGRLGVSFSNTTLDAFGLRFYRGTDSGTYNGQFSVAYEYMPIPEPSILAFAAMTMLLFAWSRTRRMTFKGSRSTTGS